MFLHVDLELFIHFGKFLSHYLFEYWLFLISYYSFLFCHLYYLHSHISLLPN